MGVIDKYSYKYLSRPFSFPFRLYCIRLSLMLLS